MASEPMLHFRTQTMDNGIVVITDALGTVISAVAPPLREATDAELFDLLQRARGARNVQDAMQMIRREWRIVRRN